MRARQLIVLTALVTASLLGPPAVRGEPYFMVRSGAKCNDCHVNQTGGGMRTAFAHIHARDILRDLNFLPLPSGVKPLNPQVHERVRLGLNLRVRDTMIFEDRRDRRGRVPNNEAFRSRVRSNEIDVNQFLAFGLVDLWPDVLQFYVDEDLNGGANNREVMGIIRGFLPWDAYVKFGRLFPTYGLRVQDDQAFIRARSGFTFQNPDDGAEMGFAPGPFFVATSITNGIEGDRDLQATVNGYGVFEDVPVVRNVLAGASFARQSSERWVAGLYGGANLWRFTGLGEFDLIDDRTFERVTATDAGGREFVVDRVPTATSKDQFAAYAELNFLLLDWLNLRGTFDFVKVAGDRDQTRYAVGLEPFLNRFLQPRLQYRINNGPPGMPDLNTAELLFELHMFL